MNEDQLIPPMFWLDAVDAWRPIEPYEESTIEYSSSRKQLIQNEATHLLEGPSSVGLLLRTKEHQHVIAQERC